MQWQAVVHLFCYIFNVFCFVHAMKVSWIQCFLDNNFQILLKNIFYWVPQNIDSQIFRMTFEFIFGWTKFSTYYLLSSSLELQYRTHFDVIVLKSITTLGVFDLFSGALWYNLSHSYCHQHYTWWLSVWGSGVCEFKKLLTWHAIVKIVGQSCLYDSHFEES